jgi:putative tricarboxylic transport membrane protein
MKVRTNLVGGILFVIIAAVILWLIPSQIAMPEVQSAGVNPRLMPRVVSIIILVCGALLIVQSLFLKKEEVIEVHFKKEQSTALVVALVMVLFTVLIIKIGFLIGSFVMIFTLMYFYGVRKIKPYITCFAWATVIYLMFVYVFNIGLPGIGGI